MARFNSRDSVFTIADNTNTTRDLSNFITSVDGLPGERELSDVTALGDSGRRFIPSLQNVTITLEGVYDDSATSGPDAVLGPLLTNTTASAFVFGPRGITGTNVYRYSGNAWVRRYVTPSRVGEMVAWRSELQVDNVVARST